MASPQVGDSPPRNMLNSNRSHQSKSFQLHSRLQSHRRLRHRHYVEDVLQYTAQRPADNNHATVSSSSNFRGEDKMNGEALTPPAQLNRIEQWEMENNNLSNHELGAPQARRATGNEHEGPSSSRIHPQPTTSSNSLYGTTAIVASGAMPSSHPFGNGTAKREILTKVGPGILNVTLPQMGFVQCGSVQVPLVVAPNTSVHVSVMDSE